ncbi:hypothetical protein [Caniella muris]|uniref:hypothetical protein n=1 Tax=Caniella muris TaxID=2941502 RepID=UPI00203EBB30|nr:hypothetical protein [Caniella muris]
MDPSVSHQSIHTGTLTDAVDRLFAPESKELSSVFTSRAVAADVLDDACEQIDRVRRRMAGPPRTTRAVVNIAKADCGVSLRWAAGRLEASRSQRAQVVFVAPDPASAKVAILTAYPQFSRKDPAADVDLEAALCASRRFRRAPYEEALPIRLAAYLGRDVHVLMDAGVPKVFLPVDDRQNPGLHLALTVTGRAVAPSGFATKGAAAGGRALFDVVPQGLERLMGLDARRALTAYCQTHGGFSKRLLRAPRLVEDPKAITDAELARRAMAFQRETGAAAEDARRRRDGGLGQRPETGDSRAMGL